MNSLVEEVVVEAGKTVTLGCPGVTEDSLVLMLEWRANGMRLLEYKSSSTTVVRHFRDRMSLSLKNYSLHLHPVTAADSGTYECVVNNRNALDAVIKLIVRGECVSFLFSGFALCALRASLFDLAQTTKSARFADFRANERRVKDSSVLLDDKHRRIAISPISRHSRRYSHGILKPAC